MVSRLTIDVMTGRQYFHDVALAAIIGGCDGPCQLLAGYTGVLRDIGAFAFQDSDSHIAGLNRVFPRARSDEIRKAVDIGLPEAVTMISFFEFAIALR